MILPTKHISEDQALIGIGALLLKEIKQPQTVTGLWERVRSYQMVGTFERFVLALNMLYILGAITLTNGMIERTYP
jgi:hypothetical protein